MHVLLTTPPDTALTPWNALMQFVNMPGSWKLIGLLIFAFVFKECFGFPKKRKEFCDRRPRSKKQKPAPLNRSPGDWRQPVVGEIPHGVSAAAKARGEEGEKVVRNDLVQELPPDLYHVFHGIMIRTPEGRLAEIDHVVVSAFGVFVIETKNYSGWIFGTAEDQEWTFKFLGGSKMSRQNPLRQNEGHIRALAGLLQVPESYCLNLVCLTGSAEIKTAPISGVLHSGTGQHIKSFQNVLFSIEWVRKMYQQLMLADESRCEASRQEHANYVQSVNCRRRAA